MNPGKWGKGRRVLVITAVEAEREALMRGLRDDPAFDILVGGVGPIAAAASAAKALAAADYSLVVSAGIGGGFPGRAEVGSLVLASRIIAADLGAETPEGFKGLEELGLGTTCIQVEGGLVNRIAEAFEAAELPVIIGPVLTVSTVTGTAPTARGLAARIEGAAAEAMEGYGVAQAAYNEGLPVIELRAISNVVGPRDRELWQIKEALELLEKSGSVMSEVFK